MTTAPRVLLSILLAWIFGKKQKRNEDIPYEI